jgi:hypothetical protein
LALDWGDYANPILAKRIIELAKAGERNPDLSVTGPSLWP